MERWLLSVPEVPKPQKSGILPTTIWKPNFRRKARAQLTSALMDAGWRACGPNGGWVWAVGSWQPGVQLPAGRGVIFTPDGSLVGVLDKSVATFIDPENGRTVFTLEDPNQDRPYALTFTPDGSQLVATNHDSFSTHVWDLRRIRAQLKEIDLDWDAPEYPSAPLTNAPLRIKAAPGIFLPKPQVVRGIQGGRAEPVFRDRGPDASLLVGFEIGLRPWNNQYGEYEVVNALRPIYRSGTTESMGKQFGRALSLPIRVVAKPGYTIGAITVNSAWVVDGFSATFMKVSNGHLDPADSYESDWIGGPYGEASARVNGNGAFVVGLIGKANATELTGMGLLFAGDDETDPKATQKAKLPVHSAVAFPAPPESNPSGKTDHVMLGGTPGRNMVNLVDKDIPGEFELDEVTLWKAKLGSRSYGGPTGAGPDFLRDK